MHVYYCRKCKTDSFSPVCEHCGLPISAQNERFCWCVRRLPLSDAPAIAGAFKVLILTLVVLVVCLFVGELIVSPDKQSAVSMLVNSGITPWVLIMGAACAAVVLVVMGLRGPEELHYTVDYRGAHLQVWIEPTRLRCLARFISYERYGIVTCEDGTQRMRVYESRILWNDVARYEVRRHSGRIDLYRPGSYRFMSLYALMEDMAPLQEFVSARLKHLPQKG